MAEKCTLNGIGRKCGGLVQVYRSETFANKTLTVCGNHYHWIQTPQSKGDGEQMDKYIPFEMPKDREIRLRLDKPRKERE